ncbi:MAG: tetratricopeptide repeat protein [Spirulinaceae cyanobacterium SM2_1_0]|nr:tetratricopeptide repeat protein [Spirulinaceae cyanobacterium SM2_1_0]
MGIVLVVGIGWMISLCLHEFGHAIVAYWGGDKSVQDKGYLTLNPLKYTDPTLSLMLPLFFLLIGGLALPGGAVYINRSLLRNRLWESAVSAAGPLANALVAILLALVLQQALSRPATPNWFLPGLAFLILLQIAAVFLNLIPIPPLDGYGIIEPWLPATMQQSLKQVGRYGIWIVFALFWFVPAFSQFFWGTTTGISGQLGVPPGLAWSGYETFRERSLLLILGLVVLFWLFRNKEHALCQKGNAKLRSQRYDQALNAFDQAIERRSDYHEAWFGRGNALAGLHNYEEAFASYNKAIQIQPDSASVWFNRGLVLLELQELEAAAKSFANAGDRTTDQHLAAYSWGYRGQALRQLDRLPEALAAYEQATAADPKFQSSWIWQADVLEKLERPTEALAALDQALQLKERQPELWVRRGDLLNHLRRFEAAFSDCEQAIALAPDLASAWVTRGVALMKLGRQEEAISSYRQALHLQPELAVAWYNQACAHTAQGDHAAAFSALARALELSPESLRTAAEGDRALAALHDDPRWKKLVAQPST